METFTANDAKQKFGELIDQALQEPVSITRHGRPSVVVTSEAEYRELMSLKHANLKAEVQKGFESFSSSEAPSRSIDEIAKRLMERKRNRKT